MEGSMSGKVLRCPATGGIMLMMCASIVLALSGTIGGQSAPLQNESAQAREELPFGDLFTPDELHASFFAQQFTPYGNSKFSFNILVPKGWEGHLSEVDPDQLTHDDQAPVPMVDFSPSGVDDVGANALYMRVPAQTTLDHFLDNYVKDAGGTLLTRQKLELKGRAYEDVLMRTTDDSLGPMLNRVSAFRRGDLVFIFTGWGVDEKYEKYKRAFGAILASFNPTGN
jgi:hypothetical protein